MMTQIDQSLKPRLAWWHRARLSLLVLIVLVAASFTVLVVSQVHQPQASTLVRRIDWQHPVRVPGFGMDHSGIGGPSGDILTPLAHAGGAAQAVVPQGNFPSNECYQGWAYPIWAPVSNGSKAWTNVWSYNGGRGLEAWVQYLWCPRWAGDTGGVNFSYGRAYELTSGCRWIGVGGDDGARISDNVNLSAQDGEDITDYWICQGHYAWDYSLTVPGEFSYTVGMVARDATNGTLTAVWSPCCY